MNQTFKYNDIFTLESGRSLSSFKMVYKTWGQLNENKSNVIWIVHALTANADAQEWWPGVVGEGCAIDPEKYFIICANAISSPYGSTSPLDINEDNGLPYFHDFPWLTTRDMARSFELLRLHLGLPKIKLLVGASIGGQQALEWAILKNEVFENLVLIATNAKHSAWGIAFNESQRMAIEADATWLEKNENAGLKGLKAARSIALLSYRTSLGYNLGQTEDENDKIDQFKASNYQSYQGDKLVKRFNAFSYYFLTKTMDSHNVGRGKNSIESALAAIKAKTTLIGITSDILFPIAEQAFIANGIKDSGFITIESPLGHDGFLTEAKKIGSILKTALTESKTETYIIEKEEILN